MTAEMVAALVSALRGVALGGNSGPAMMVEFCDDGYLCDHTECVAARQALAEAEVSEPVTDRPPARWREGAREMRTPIYEKHHRDAEGRPAGGVTIGRGFTIAWQDGPLSVDGMRRQPTGAFVEDVIAAALGRLTEYQASMFACDENARARVSLENALYFLDQRTQDRQRRGVEGSHRV